MQFGAPLSRISSVNVNILPLQQNAQIYSRKCRWCLHFFPNFVSRLFFNSPEDWDLSWGGFSSYQAKNEDEELLTAPPVPNTLSLVYRDAETFGFVKFLNSRFPKEEYHDIALSYIEQSPDE